MANGDSGGSWVASIYAWARSQKLGEKRTNKKIYLWKTRPVIRLTRSLSEMTNHRLRQRLGSMDKEVRSMLGRRGNRRIYLILDEIRLTTSTSKRQTKGFTEKQTVTRRLGLCSQKHQKLGKQPSIRPEIRVMMSARALPYFGSVDEDSYVRPKRNQK
jgi:hypothetical protein